MENWINDIDIPTITAINGPGLHWENAFMSDITLCAPDFILRYNHFDDIKSLWTDEEKNK